jgi:anti-sigma regulatory factor (Ser/Thr protein kinase)
MNFIRRAIRGGDFDRGGAASRRLKEQLKKIGADPAAIRRAMIAAYEAEMNVVIHARKGLLRATFDTGRLNVEVVDEGPGISDIDQAMKEGYSTAPADARELGFGAGMGLPNIKRNSDRFSIESAVGRGTRVAFTIFLRPQPSAAAGRNSILVAAEKCRECMACLRACPTRALRVRGGRPEILQHLCIDCAACLAACESGALTSAVAADVLSPAEAAVLVVPAALLAQFGPSARPERVLAALADLGFREVRLADAWQQALGEAVRDYARHDSQVRPVISPACPAVVNLIETRYPSLIAHLAPFASPMEAAKEELAGRRAVFVAACPCQQTVLGAGLAVDSATILPATLRGLLAPRLARENSGPVARDERRGAPAEERGLLRVTGLKHVMATLEELENGLLEDVAILEPWLCDEGCFGSPLFAEDAFVARERGSAGAAQPASRAGAMRRRAPYQARAGLRLDGDMAVAIRKLAQLDQLIRSLPGRDCGQCGAPTCAALAEDIVRGAATEAACVHTKQRGKGRT